ITFVCAIEIIVFSDKTNEFHNVNCENGCRLSGFPLQSSFLGHYIMEELHFGTHEHCILIRSNQVYYWD
ncbi:thioredoxin-dependent peroxide reductase, partial [Cricetulus griseus]